MNYGIFRKADLHVEQSRLVAFVDIGYSKTSFFIAAVKKNGAEILYEKIERNLGVRNFDQNMIDFYIEDFMKKNKKIRFNENAGILLNEYLKLFDKGGQNQKAKIPKTFYFIIRCMLSFDYNTRPGIEELNHALIRFKKSKTVYKMIIFI